jgi:hypothetical protein
MLLQSPHRRVSEHQLAPKTRTTSARIALDPPSAAQFLDKGVETVPLARRQRESRGAHRLGGIARALSAAVASRTSRGSSAAIIVASG